MSTPRCCGKTTRSISSIGMAPRRTSSPIHYGANVCDSILKPGVNWTDVIFFETIRQSDLFLAALFQSEMEANVPSRGLVYPVLRGIPLLVDEKQPAGIQWIHDMIEQAVVGHVLLDPDA